jgi:thiol-disulfide isomerase/thioredoxin
MTLVAAGVGVAVCAGSVVAQGDAEKAGAAKGELPDLARQTLERAAKAVGDIKTYQDRVEMRFLVTRKGDEGKAEENEEHSDELSMWFQAPRSFKAIWSDMTLMSDGDKVYSVWEDGGQYLEQEFPSDVNAALDEEESYLIRASYYPGLTVLLRRPASANDYFRDHITITGAEREAVDGEPCVRLDGTNRGRNQPLEKPIPASFWFSERSGLMVKAVNDHTEEYKERGGGDRFLGDAESIEKAVWVITFHDVKVDEAIDPDTFKVPEGLEKVEEFSRGDAFVMDDERAQEEEEEAEEGAALLGKPAPEFSGRLLDGSEFSLGSLKGRVVVMDFWATWCPPCVASIPSIQKMSEKFAAAESPVTVIGINQDQGKTRTVKSFVDKRKITFQQVMDEGEIGNLYGVTGIPTTVILDREGVVQYVHIGGSATIGDELGVKVEKILKGEKLYTPPSAGEIAAKAARKKAEASAPPPVTEVSPARLVEGKRSAVQAYPMGRETLRAAAPGELVVPTPEGELAIISGPDASVKTVRIPGARAGGRMMLQDAGRARLAGKEGWLVTGTSYRGSTSSAVAAFHDEKGAKVWALAPAPVNNTFASVYVDVGDVTGDGEDEVVAAYSVMPRGGRGRGEKYGAWLIVLDGEGKMLTSRKIGEHAYGLWLAPADGTGARAIVVLDGTVRRFTVQEGGGQVAEEEPSTKP